MRRLVLFVLLVSGTAHGATTFVTPQTGAQTIGPQILEVTTDARGVDRVEFYVDGVLVGVARSEPYRIAHDFGTSVEPRVIRAKVLSDGYRRSETADVVTASLTAGESMNVDVVEVPLRVRSARMLEARDIRVRENSVRQTVRQVLPQRGATHFAFVVDRSLSMGGGKLAAAVSAVDAAMVHLRRGDTASLILFNHHVERPRTLRERGDASELTSTTPSGGTSMRDAVASAVATGSRRTHVVVISDGGDRNSLLSDEDALRRLSGARTIVSAVILGNSSPFLQRAAAATGGTILAATRKSVRGQVQRLIDDINSRYTVVYQSSGTAAGWRTIDVTAVTRGVEVAGARKRYFAE